MGTPITGRVVRLSIAIAVHFAFNFAHLALFTYPLAHH
jgi:membrane protease YdiL (CAAX protease family)